MDEITEIENDESPNRKAKRDTKPLHMGFQVEESKEPRYFPITRDEEGNGSFDNS